MTIKLILVDDQSTVREGLKMRFALEPDLRVVGEAGNGVEALQAAQTLAPDVVVMDVEMPQMDGISATKLLRALTPQIGVVMLSIHSDAETRMRVLDAGADAFVEKQGTDADLLAAIRQAAYRSTN